MKLSKKCFLFSVISAVVPQHYSTELDFCKQKCAGTGDRAVNNTGSTKPFHKPFHVSGMGVGRGQRKPLLFFFRWIQSKLMLIESIRKLHCSLASWETTTKEKHIHTDRSSFCTSFAKNTE